MGCCSRKATLYSLFISGVILIITFTVLLILWPSLFFNILKNQLVLTPTSASYDLWKETPIPMYLDLFLYNLTNSKDAKNDTTKFIPHFEQLGPYVFKEHHIKVNETWNSNGTVTYLQRRIWNFEPSRSNGSLDDQVTNINVIAMTIGNFVRHRSILIRLMVNGLLKIYGEGMFVTKRAGDLLFDGYSDRLLDVVQNLTISGINIPFDKFGWFYERNLSDTYDGVMTMDTGLNDPDKLGDLQLWNYKPRVDFYEGECGAVNGGAGELFPPRYKPSNITIFATDVCSSVTLKRSGDLEVEGISGSLFIGDDSVFDNGHNYSEMACFCPKNGPCPPYGSRDVSLCRMGAPAFVSFPHFYLADPVYLSKIDGIVPNREDDEFRMGLEVQTGIPLLVRAQLQINIHIKKVDNIDIYNDVPDDIYIPMLWFRQEVRLTKDYATMAKLALLAPTIGTGVFSALIAIGVILLTSGFIVIFKGRMSRSESTDLLTSEK